MTNQEKQEIERLNEGDAECKEEAAILNQEDLEGVTGGSMFAEIVKQASPFRRTSTEERK